MTSFRPLEADEPVGVVALSGPVDPERLAAGLEALRGWGRPLLLAPNLESSRGYLAGSDDERLDGLERVLDGGARVVMAARGGYGIGRLMARLPWKRLVADGIRFVGFSDLTALLNPLAVRDGAVQVHGPMVAAGLADARNRRRLEGLLCGELRGETLFSFRDSAVVVSGRVRGRALGGNLSLLASLLGTPFEVPLDGSVLFLEEVGEPLYRVDRMLTHLRSSATFRKVKALISGSLRGCRPAGERATRWRELVEEAAPEGAAVVVDQPFGHGASNLAFPIGATVEVDTTAGTLRWIA